MKAAAPAGNRSTSLVAKHLRWFKRAHEKYTDWLSSTHIPGMTQVLMETFRYEIACLEGLKSSINGVKTCASKTARARNTVSSLKQDIVKMEGQKRSETDTTKLQKIESKLKSLEQNLLNATETCKEQLVFLRFSDSGTMGYELKRFKHERACRMDVLRDSVVALHKDYADSVIDVWSGMVPGSGTNRSHRSLPAARRSPVSEAQRQKLISERRSPTHTPTYSVDTNPNALMDAMKTATLSEDGQDPEKEKEKDATIARALFDFNASKNDEMTLVAGQRITVGQCEDVNWWYAEDPESGQSGYVPRNYVEVIGDAAGDESMPEPEPEPEPELTSVNACAAANEFHCKYASITIASTI